MTIIQITRKSKIKNVPLKKKKKITITNQSDLYDHLSKQISTISYYPRLFLNTLYVLKRHHTTCCTKKTRLHDTQAHARQTQSYHIAWHTIIVTSQKNSSDETKLRMCSRERENRKYIII